MANLRYNHIVYR